ncbi:MAG TPA: acyl-CoA dehydrogenase family protein [Baekduia sp.]|nr:acyl-CoA dehydrogenase family protein [Baekduia sp.]
MATATVPSRQELVERARSLRPLLTAYAEQADRDRVLAPEVVDAITEAGLFKLLVPKRLGGYETDVLTMLDVLTELSKGCVSASWVTGVLSFAAWQIGMFTDQAQRDVFEENPDARVCWSLSAAVEVKPGEGGTIVSGRWPNASGSAQADWALLGLPLAFGPRGPEFSMALIPMSETTIDDTWDIAGVRGSASNTIVAQEVFVPEHRWLALAAATEEGAILSPHTGETLYRTAWSVGGYALLGSQLGVASAMLELVLERSEGKMIPAAGIMDQSEWATFQMEAAEAATKIDAAIMLTRRDAEQVDAVSRRGERMSQLDRARIRNNQAWASNQLKEAAEILMVEAGVTAFFGESPLQRMWRDLSVAHAHTGFRLKPNQEKYGRALTGKEVGPMPMG